MICSLPDGIYFDLPDSVYFAIPRLSASGIQNLIKSPATFWAGSWLYARKAAMLCAAALAALAVTPEGHKAHASATIAAVRALHPNIDRVRPLKEKADTKATQLGRAYHTARLEPDQLEARFCRELDPADFDADGAVWTGADIEREFAARDLTKKLTGEKVMDQARRLAAEGFDKLIWPLEMARWNEALNGRTPIAPDKWDDLLEAVDQLQGSEVHRLLTGGVAEVTVLWTDANEIKMKCRIDYLRPDGWTDIKTFENVRGKEIEQAMLDAFRFGRHYIQAAVYREPIELMRADALPIIGPSTEHQRQVIGRIATSPAEMECWFVYIEKGVPNIFGRQIEFFDVPEAVKTQNTLVGAAGFADAEGIERVEKATRTLTFLHRRAMHEIDTAKRTFLDYSEIYEPGRPWQPWNALRKWDDMSFPDFWLRNEGS